MQSIINTVTPFVTTIDYAFWVYIAATIVSLVFYIPPVQKYYFGKNIDLALGKVSGVAFFAITFAVLTAIAIAILIYCVRQGVEGTVTAIVYTSLVWIALWNPVHNYQAKIKEEVASKRGVIVF